MFMFFQASGANSNPEKIPDPSSLKAHGLEYRVGYHLRMEGTLVIWGDGGGS